jgi:hypothetical protein
MTHRWCQVELDVPIRKFRFPTVYDTKVQIATVTVAADHVTVRFHRRAPPHHHRLGDARQFHLRPVVERRRPSPDGVNRANS